MRWIVLGIVLAPLAALSFVVRSYNFDGRAMEPALHADTRFLLNRFSYVLGEPEAGDIAVVISPADELSIVKRVIGVPGDRIAVEGYRVRINGTFITTAFEPCGGSSPEDLCATETIHGRHWRVTARSFDVNYPNMEERLLPEGAYFLLGDHRDMSNDSRNPSVGPVDRAHFVGRMIVAFDAPSFPWARLVP